MRNRAIVITISLLFAMQLVIGTAAGADRNGPLTITRVTRLGPVPYDVRFKVLAVELNGRSHRLITGAGGAFLYPSSWSPDGSQLALVSVDSHFGPCHIDIFDAATEDETSIYTVEDVDVCLSHPVWSPDGAQLLFSQGRQLFVMATDGSDVVEIPLPVTGSIAGFDWSPDGSQIVIAMHRWTGVSLMFVMDDDGSNAEAILRCEKKTCDWPRVAEPDWSPDGSKIAFTWGPHLSMIDPDGTSPHVVSECPRFGPGLSCGHPVWAPAGDWIGFERGSGVWVVRPDGSRLHRVTDGWGLGAWRPRPA